MSALEVVKTSARLPDLSRVLVVDEVGVNERVARFEGDGAFPGGHLRHVVQGEKQEHYGDRLDRDLRQRQVRCGITREHQ